MTPVLSGASAQILRTKAGRFVSRRCPDPNCDGALQFNAHGFWAGSWLCDGLTYLEETGSLFACEESVDPFVLEAAA